MASRAVVRGLSLFLDQWSPVRGHAYHPSPTPTAQNLGHALRRDSECFGQFDHRLTFGIPGADPAIAVALGWRVIGKGKRRWVLPNLHEQHPVVDRVRKMWESPDTEALWGIWGTSFP
jgi:hypothetical protein